MHNDLVQLSQHFLRMRNRHYVRFFLKTNPFKNRFSVLSGPRGVGKTTLLIQYLLQQSKNNAFSTDILYLPADHFLIGKKTLYEISEDFCKFNGKLICFDEIHKYPNWSKELKSIYDTFPSLKILASGSSALEISKGTHDLSRRAIQFYLPGMSFREYLELTHGLRLDKFSLADILTRHLTCAESIINRIERLKTKILVEFQNYLQTGYYPYFTEYPEKEQFFMSLEQNAHTSIESDLLAVYPSLTGTAIQKIKKLLSVIASSVPFIPDLNKLKQLIDVGDERTLKTYLYHLEKAGLIKAISQKGSPLHQMAKPGKIFLSNTNIVHALKNPEREEIGMIRETFFMSMLSFQHALSLPKKGDFLVNNKYIFEVGGKNKTFKQIQGINQAYLAMDGIEIGSSHKIPLWLFGFVY